VEGGFGLGVVRGDYTKKAMRIWGGWRKDECGADGMVDVE
jgi:hypothetical protein